MASSLDKAVQYASLTRTEKFKCYAKSHKATIAQFALFTALIITCAVFTALSFKLSGGFNSQSIQQADGLLKLTWGLTSLSLVLTLISGIPNRKALHEEYDKILARKNKTEIDDSITELKEKPASL